MAKPLALALSLLLASPALGDLDVSSLIDNPETRALAQDEQRAHAGDPQAQFRLAKRYDSGRGVARSYPEALKWYRLAAEQGHAEAALNVGLMYQEGHGVRRDRAAALRWLQRAAEAGSGDAQYALGLMHYQGDGVPVDYAAAMRWYLKAASRGNAKAMNNLGIMHGLGEGGVEPNDLNAYAWFSLAADRGDGNAATNRDLAAKELSAEKLEVAKQRARSLATELGLN